MNWLEKLKGKAGQLAPDQDQRRQETPRPAAGTVVRVDATPAPTIAKAGPRFEANDEVTADLQIKSLLGSGGMGEVYLARQRMWNVDIALKIPNDEILSDPENRHRIVREAEAWTDLGLHPNIAYCYYAQPLGELLLLVIEYVDGGNLRDWIADGRCADLKTGMDLAIQFCHGLEHAHKKGLIHRDIKPENVLLMKDGTLKITDFGVVRKALASPERLQSSGATRGVAAGMTAVGIGTADYMAPEQWGDQSEIDHRADIFAFGVCLYEMLCGGRPYATTAGQRQEAPDPGKMRGGKGLPEKLNTLMKRCVDWDPAKRPTSAQKVRAELSSAYKEMFGKTCLYAELPELIAQADDWNNRALSLMALGKVEDAEVAWQIALEADPRHAESIYNYGLHRWRDAKATDREVVREMRAVVESEASAWLPKCLLASLHLERGDCEGAGKELAKLEGDGNARAGAIAIQNSLSESGASGIIRTFQGCGSRDRSVWLSADGRFALSGCHDILKFAEVETGLLLRTFRGHTGDVNTVCLTEGGRLALSGSDDKTLKLWDVGSGNCLRTLNGHTEGVKSVRFTRDGRYALSGSRDKTLKLWNVADGACLRTFKGHTSYVYSVCFSGDGLLALSGSWDSTVMLWDIASGQSLRTFKVGISLVNAVWLSADGHRALSGGSDNTVNLWDVESGRSLHSLKGHTENVNSVCLSGDGRTALSGSSDGELRLWDVASGRCLRTFEGDESGLDSVNSVYLSRDARRALSGHNICGMKLWKIGAFEYRAGSRLSFGALTGEAISLANQQEAALTAARRAFAADDFPGAYRTLRSAREDPRLRRARPIVQEWARLYVRLRLRSLDDCRVQWVAGHAKWVASVSTSVDGRNVLTGSWDNTVRLWDVESGHCVRVFQGHTHPVQSVCLSADGRHAFSGSSDMTIKHWDVPSGHCLRTFEGHSESVESVLASQNGRFVLSGSKDKMAGLWDVESGRCLRTFEGHTNGVHSVCFGADDRYAVSASDDKSLKLWDVESGRCLRTFAGHTSTVYSCHMSADGLHLLSGGLDGTLKLWEVTSGCCLRTFQGHRTTVYSVHLSSDGRHALSGSLDKTLKLWDVSSGKCLRTLEHSTSVQSVCLSADGSHLVSGGKDGSVTLWFLDWELEEKQPADWDEGARPHLDVFLRTHRPYAGSLPKDRQPTDEEVTRALTRRGRPEWTEQHFQKFLHTLGCAGYGWLRPEGVRRELVRMAAAWRDPE